MGVTEDAEHWDGIYTNNPVTNLSWYEREPTVPLALVKKFASGTTGPVIDIGSGESSLVDRLLADGFADVTALDISHRALAAIRERLGECAASIAFVVHDVVTWKPSRQYEVWHDRAVFHFLTDDAARDQYLEVAARGIRVGGSLVLATFAEDGPTQCSGLPVTRYSTEELARTFSASFSLVEHGREEHLTPAGAVQSFTWVVLRRDRK